MNLLTTLDAKAPQVRLLGSAFLLIMLAISLLIAPWGPLALVALVFGTSAIVYVLQKPVWNLAFILVSFFLITGYEAGIQIEEVLFLALYHAYIGLWIISRLFKSPGIFVETPLDKIITFHLLFITIIGLILLFVNQGDVILGANEWFSMGVFVLYFPIKEACNQGKRETFIVVSGFLLLLLLIIIRNLLLYQSLLQNVEMLYQLLKGRININEVLLLHGSLLTIALLLFEKRKTYRFVFISIAGLCVLGLLLGQSRSYWVSFAFGLALLMLLVPQRERIRLVQYGTIGFLVAFFILYLFLQDTLWVLIDTYMMRFLSIGSALSEDMSYVNRLIESKGTLKAISKQPLLGYGFGSYYETWDAIDKATHTKNYAHNGYLSVLFKVGALGFLTHLLVFVGGIWKGFRFLRFKDAPPYTQALVLSSLVTILAMLPAGIAASPFLTADTTLAYTLSVALIASSYAIAQREQPLPRST